MKGATAEDSAKMMRKPNKMRMRIGGPSHQIFLTFRNSQSSAMIEIRCLADLMAFMLIFLQ